MWAISMLVLLFRIQPIKLHHLSRNVASLKLLKFWSRHAQFYDSIVLEKNDINVGYMQCSHPQENKYRLDGQRFPESGKVNHLARLYFTCPKLNLLLICLKMDC